MKIKEIIVVEGKSDTVRIKHAVDADTIETNGSAINKQTLEQIQHAQEKRGVIIFTDPDYPGKRIRNIIDEAVKGCKHAFLSAHEARAKHPDNKSIGIEHASPKAIKRALEDVYELIEEQETQIHKEDLIDHGLIGGVKSRQLRGRLGEILKIGHTNGKQLQKRLNMFNISIEQLEKMMALIQQEETNETE